MAWHQDLLTDLLTEGVPSYSMGLHVCHDFMFPTFK